MSPTLMSETSTKTGECAVEHRSKQKIMKLENQVCSLGLAKRLKELGVSAPALFYYAEIHMDKRVNEGLSFEQQLDGITEDGKAIWGAYKSAALFSNFPQTYYPLWLAEDWMLEHLLEGGSSWTSGDFEHDYLEYAGDEIPAYTSVELGVMLPAGFQTWFDGDVWHCSDGYENPFHMLGITEVEAKANELISRIEVSCMSAQEVNERLLNA